MCGIGALLRFVSFGVSGWLAARLDARQSKLVMAVLFAATVAMWPMPWEIRVLEYGVQWLAHYGTALVGIFVGSWIASARRAQVNPSPEA